MAILPEHDGEAVLIGAAVAVPCAAVNALSPWMVQLQVSPAPSLPPMTTVRRVVMDGAPKRLMLGKKGTGVPPAEEFHVRAEYATDG